MLTYADVELFKDDGFGRTAEQWILNSQKVRGIVIGSFYDLVRWKDKLMKMPGRNPRKISIDQDDYEALSDFLSDEYYREQYRIGEENIWY